MQTEKGPTMLSLCSAGNQKQGFGTCWTNTLPTELHPQAVAGLVCFYFTTS